MYFELGFRHQVESDLYESVVLQAYPVAADGHAEMADVKPLVARIVAVGFYLHKLLDTMAGFGQFEAGVLNASTNSFVDNLVVVLLKYWVR